MEATWHNEKWARHVPGPVMDETLDNIEHDDKRPPTLAEAVKEAHYVLGLYNEGGTDARAELEGEYGSEAQKAARAEVRQCKAFIKKYSNAAEQISKAGDDKIRLRLTPSIVNEWQVRCIGDVIPELKDLPLAPTISVTVSCCEEIAADCEFYLDPNGPETSIGERSAYRALLKQCKTALQAHSPASKPAKQAAHCGATVRQNA